MAKKLYEETDIQAIASAIRGKNGTTETYKTSEMADAITNLPTSGGSEAIIVPLTVTENRTYTAIEGGVDGYAPITVRVPMNLMAEKEITENGLYFASTDGYDGYLTVDVNVASSGDHSYEDALIAGTATEYVNDRVTAVGQYAFSSNKTLQKVKFANALTIGQGAFQQCSALIEADLGSVTTIGETAFYGCSNLRKLILRSDSVVTLGGSAVFSNSSFSTYGWVYVPAALQNAYQTASGWSQLKSRITTITPGM